MGTARLYRDNGYRRLWLAQGLSILGTQASLVALPLVVLSQLRSPTDLGVVAVVEAAATVGALPLAGPLNDRFGYKLVMVGCDAVRVVPLVMLAWLVFTHRVSLPAVLAVAVIDSTLGVVFSSASTATFRLVVPPERLATALSYNQGRFAVVSVGGPALGAALYAWAPPLAFLVDAASFLLSAGCVTSVRLAAVPPRRTARRRQATPFDGWRFLWRLPCLRHLIFAMTLTNFSISGVMLTLTTLYGTTGRAPVTGVVLAVAGLANLIGSFGIAPSMRVISPRTLVPMSAAVIAAAVLLIPVGAASVAWVCSLIGLCCLTSPASQTLTQTILLRNAPADLVGRAQAVFQVVPQLVASLGPLAGAYLLTRISTSGAVLVFGGLLALVTVFCLLSPRIRGIAAT
ncbi:MFS transporter [Amycolatopsis sp. NBC_00345]|uniref:MFS transporter n=1 Tax=Amycolatopsis sp. NBC_00345 TaxID=2975955 RepID=UPI002E271C53